MFVDLNKRTSVEQTIIENSSIFTEIDFELRDEVIYHVHDEFFKFCVSKSAIKNVFQLAHNDNAHAEHHRAYQRVVDLIYIHKLFKKLDIYIQHCLSCQLNQTKRHRFYEE